jgi:adenylate cyclase
MEFRIGVNLGDVMVEGAQIYGDGVNVAARLESLAEPGGICISGTAHDQVQDKIPLDYEDLGQQAVKNISRPVHVWRVPLDGETSLPRKSRQIPRKYLRAGVLSVAGLAIVIATIVLVQHLSLRPQPTHASIPPSEKPALPLPSIPSIAVLPFINLSGDPQQEYFSDGITDDLVTDLSRLPGLFVIDRNSTFAYKGKAARVQVVGRELGVKYVLEGSARRATDRIRINVQLVDTRTGNQVWAQRYDKQFRDVFALQDEIVQSLIATLNLQLPLLEEGIVVPQRTKSLEAYDYLLRAWEYFRTLTPDGFAKARKMLEKAIDLDPGYVDAYGLLSFSYFVGYLFEWDREPGVLDRAAELVEKTITLDDTAAGAYAVRGWIGAMKNRHDQAIADGKRAVSLNPNSAFACQALADINLILSAGNPEEALAYTRKAIRLDPRHPEVYRIQEGVAYNRMGRHAEAVDALKKAQQNNPWVHVNLVWAYSELGREPEARSEAAEVLRISPSFSVEELRGRLPYWREPGAQSLLAELRQAGLK